MNLNPINSRLRVPLGAAIFLATFATLPARADYQSTVLSQGPAGYWRLNETTQPPPPPINATNIGSVGSPAGDGEYIDAIRGVTPGAIVSEPASAAVKFTADVDGNRVRIPYQPQWNTTGPFSVELWIRPDRTNTTQCIAADVEFIASPVQRNGWLIYQGNSPTLSDGQGWSFRLYNSTGLAGISRADWVGPLDPAAWYHIVGTFDGTTINLYVNGALAATSPIAGTFRANTNSAIPLTFGSRADGASGYFASAATFDEAAYYTAALSADRVLAHYQAGTNSLPPTPYRQVVLNDGPVGYWRFNEPGDVAAVNIGTLGSAASGQYQSGTTPGVAGPRPPPYQGFENGNDAVSVPGTGPSVTVPALNLNTNTVTITGWINAANAAESAYGGIIVCDGGTTYSGLTMDFNGGLNLGYVWANDQNSFGWSPTTDSGLPSLPLSDWAYVALVVQPNQAAIYLCQSNNGTSFTGVTNPLPIVHVNQAFDAATLFGWDPNTTQPAGFGGMIDEVAIFDRALGVGELYTQVGSAVGGLEPKIFGDLQGPLGQVAAGDPIALVVDAGGTPPLTFYWRRNGVTFATTSSNSYVIASSTLNDTANYDVIISNAVNTVDSLPVAVSVVTPSVPNLVQILGYQSRTLYPTGTLNMAAIATGGGLKYQWYKNSVAIPSATSSAYTIPHVVANDAGGYSLFITNSVGTATSGPPAVITVASVTAGSYEATIVTDGPEAWWRMDEATGSTTMWDSMGRHDGYYTNLTGATPPVTLGATGALVGDTNTAASFVAANQAFGYVPFSPSLNPKLMTIECWVKTPSSTVSGLAPVSSRVTGAGWWWQTDVESGTGYWIPDGSNTGGDFRTPLEGTADAATAAIVPGEWSYLVQVIDTSSGYPITPYINGVGFGGWGFGTVGNYNGSGPLIIGARGASPGAIADRFFDGQVDEVAIYNYALTPAQITSHFNARGTVTIPVTFTTPLLSQTVTAGKSISFSTSVLGTLPISLQWYKGGAPIIGATNATYTITNTGLGDTGTYALWGTNSVSTNSLSASLTVVSPVGYANVTNNLVLHLTFDTDTTDSSGRGNDGVPSTLTASTDPPVFVPGIIGAQALQYSTFTSNAVSGNPVTNASYVYLGTPGSGPPPDLQFDDTTSFSVSLWVKQPAGSAYGDLPFIGNVTNSDNNPGWVLAPGYKTGGWEWSINDGTNGFNPNGTVPLINDGNWHNFVVTVDRSAKVANSYVDGVLAASTSIASLGNIDVGNPVPVVIGQDPTFLYPETGTATLDDIGIWRQALTPLQVAQIESAGRTSGRSFNTVGPQSVTLTIARSGGNVVLNYPSGTLLQSTNASLPMSQWTAVPGANPPSFSVTLSGAGKFYRVQAQ